MTRRSVPTALWMALSLGCAAGEDDGGVEAAHLPSEPDSGAPKEPGLEAGPEAAAAEALILADAGADLVAPPDAAPAQPAPGRPAVVAIGWGGLRVTSYDRGLTWGSRVALENGAYGSSKDSLLRTITHGAGMFVTAGSRIFTSPDGARWTERTNPHGNQWIGGLAHGNGLFVGAGGCAITVRSKDGITWEKGAQTQPGNCPTGGSLRSAAFGGGQFAIGSDGGTVFVSADALKWTIHPGLQTADVAFCNGAFRKRSDCPPQPAGGPYLRGNQSGGATLIEYSADGKSWRVVHRDTNLLTGFGFAP